MSKQAKNVSTEIESFVQGENIILKLTLTQEEDQKPLPWLGVTEVYTLHPNMSNKNTIRQRTDTEAIAEVSSFLTRADVDGDLNQTFIRLYDNVGSVAVYVDIDNSGSPAPLHGCDREIKIGTIVTGANKPTVAAAFAAILDADAKFGAIADGDSFVITDLNPGIRTDGSASTSGFTLSIPAQGADFIDGGIETPDDGDMVITIPPVLSKDLKEEARTTFWIAIDFPLPDGRTVYEILDGYAITKAPEGMPDPA